MFAALMLFGASFGFIEAAVVIDLRAVYEPIHARYYPQQAPDDLFPILRPEQLSAEGTTPFRLLRVEIAREVATLALLIGFALAAGRSKHEGFAIFAAAFGLWDIFFYASLWLLIGWPASLGTWDLLFLLPVPWVGPVWAPLVVSLTMVVAGGAVIMREATDRPLRLSHAGWGAILLGGVIVILAFCGDFRATMRGDLPNPFPWPLFLLGEGIGLAGVLGGRVDQPSRG